MNKYIKLFIVNIILFCPLFAAMPKTLPAIKSIPIAQAFALAEKQFYGKILVEVQSKINEKAIQGGMFIASNVLDAIFKDFTNLAQSSSSSSSSSTSSDAALAKELQQQEREKAAHSADAALAARLQKQEDAAHKQKGAQPAKGDKQKAAEQKNKSLSLPKAINELPHADLAGKVYYLSATSQGTNECGYWAVYNAKAFSDLFKAGVNITSARINEKTAILVKNVALDNSPISADDISNLCEVVSLNPHYICQFREKENELAFFQGPKNDPKADNIIRAFRSLAGESIGYFFCHTGFHWTSVIVVKKKNEKPYIVYMNSLNPELTKESLSYKALTFFAQLLGI